MAILNLAARLKATVIAKGEKKGFEIITVKQAAQRSTLEVQNIEYYISALEKGGETKLDIIYPFQHDGQGSGPKFIVCNKKWTDFLKNAKK